MTAAIDIQGLRRSFGPVAAVRGIDLTVAPGEVVAFLGPNGAGKTTTLDMLLGFGEPDAGTVRILGLTPREAVARGLSSAVLQTGGLLKDITVMETVQLMASFHTNPRPVTECLERAGLTDLTRRRVGKCSGGEQQRLRFALSLLSDPAVLILDEPTAGLDASSRRDFWRAMTDDADRGRTVVFATHYLEEAEAYAQRIVLVREGRVVADGSVAEITAGPGERQVEATWPDASAGALAVLAALPGVRSVRMTGTGLHVATTDGDAVARHLLNHSSAHDIRIASRGLEDAFFALTGADGADEQAGTTTEQRESIR